ncbi:hypothetical protein PACTADRAFT_5242 [Pachysolen tannophilus NRRL Y-2460]|uniref:Uncharacterized protein n=1 Tax=Pachysolen tannophilus NRRL Y-2460 TaxID=669874 RepID=A0A1E4TNX7_PACTA|nr:hypothetical protein PACTADRAFT_5242 [Pachysolen tannophilus NRRL Y-2460]
MKLFKILAPIILIGTENLSFSSAAAINSDVENFEGFSPEKRFWGTKQQVLSAGNPFVALNMKREEEQDVLNVEASSNEVDFIPQSQETQGTQEEENLVSEKSNDQDFSSVSEDSNEFLAQKQVQPEVQDQDQEQFEAQSEVEEAAPQAQAEAEVQAQVQGQIVKAGGLQENQVTASANVKWPSFLDKFLNPVKEATEAIIGENESDCGESTTDEGSKSTESKFGKTIPDYFDLNNGDAYNHDEDDCNESDHHHHHSEEEAAECGEHGTYRRRRREGDETYNDRHVFSGLTAEEEEQQKLAKKENILESDKIVLPSNLISNDPSEAIPFVKQKLYEVAPKVKLEPRQFKFSNATSTNITRVNSTSQDLESSANKAAFSENFYLTVGSIAITGFFAYF